MGKLFEVLRRLLVASIYIAGVILCGIVIKILLGDAANNTSITGYVMIAALPRMT